MILDELRQPVQDLRAHIPTANSSWLVQMGCGRGGCYTARWVDRLLFPAKGASVNRIVPELQALVEGDFVPDGPP